jgi:hypothetical protein
VSLDHDETLFTAKQACGMDVERLPDLQALTGMDLRPHLDATGPEAR